MIDDLDVHEAKTQVAAVVSSAASMRVDPSPDLCREGSQRVAQDRIYHRAARRIRSQEDYFRFQRGETFLYPGISARSVNHRPVDKKRLSTVEGRVDHGHDPFRILSCSNPHFNRTTHLRFGIITNHQN